MTYIQLCYNHSLWGYVDMKKFIVTYMARYATTKT